jgi:hypothetical protein
LQQIVPELTVLPGKTYKLFYQFLVRSLGPMPANYSQRAPFVHWFRGSLTFLQHKRYSHTVHTEIQTVRFWAVASSLKHPMGISQTDIVRMTSKNDCSRLALSRFDAADLTFLEAVQAAAEGAGTGQLDQQSLIDFDQKNIRTATSVLLAYIIAKLRIQDVRFP